MSGGPQDPLAIATAAMLRRLNGSYREALDGLDDEAVNFKPGEGTNSIYQMMQHALDVARMWISMAEGNRVPGRPEPWTFSGPIADLYQRLDEAEENIKRYLESPSAPDPAVERQLGEGMQSNAMSLLRAVRHQAEHLGHIGLTRQMWETYGSPQAQERAAAARG